MTILEIFLITCIVISIAYYLFSIYCTISFFNKQTEIDDNYLPPISILKPLNGIEDGIYENFTSYCKQDYPVYQIVFGVKDSKDPAIDVVKKVIDAFPQKDIELVICNDVVGINPKINNLNNMYKKAKYDIILTNDCDTRVNGNYLKKIVSPFRDKSVGLVTCAYRENVLNNIVSRLESIFINHDFLPSIMLARKFEELSYAFGVTIATRRGIMDKIGGFAELADYLAEDFHLGKKVFEAGHKLFLSDYIVDVISEKMGFTDYFKHQLRWSKTIKACRPMGYFFSAFFKYGIVSSLVYLLICFCFPTGTSSAQALSVTLFITFLSVRIISASIISYKFTKDRKIMLLLLPISDIISFIIWCTSFLGNKITWRGSRFLLKKGGMIEEI
ncbi:MAG: bacteriohopanetetrol glucosamine biosynthesis glycosyltransferase HpnI [Candidatus Scalindua rubra]|uniref:Ceramide glucosyltransferase n=1 Tax=Candidatus Scalindua brodae TaxID=237368 RepID=A0A0B0EGP7_9BACT|nr:MAG: ceramide glucosyltransferase [Candidatus Scalindua brodae]MBZ0107173.1 bacteriohopanetetrol glucosamine biosynthesis glycosyltransferase HpnI [Candidatus Scalindua rubra]TWU38057.1 N-glycosyltransferase [Candidatus Brocadiaceae bacterium S225]